MGLILASLVFLALGIFVFLTSVNYAWVLWERERVDSLTKQIKPTEEDDLFRRNQSREYTPSFDIKAIGKSSVNKANKAIEKTMVALSDRDYPSWVSKTIEIFNQTRKDFISSVKTFIKYLIHLAKPDDSSAIQDEYEEQLHEKAVDEAITKVKDSALASENDEDNFTLRKNSEQAHESDGNKDSEIHKFGNNSPIQVKFNSDKGSEDSATIGLSTNKKQNNEAFEKIESRILDKLKQSGLNHYNVWLELGELYIKYDEKQKAKEVFALVMKNTKNDKEKEIARNQLISL